MKREWEQLVNFELDEERSIRLLETILQKRVLFSFNPSDGSTRRRVSVDPWHCTNHILYKGNDNSRDRISANFNSERAHRLGFIEQTLLAPDWIYRSHKDHRALLYFARTLHRERWAVVITETSPRKYALKTAYPIMLERTEDREKWARQTNRNHLLIYKKTQAHHVHDALETAEGDE